MTDLYLITGFLGAGKTTFLKQLVSVFGDKKISLIVNEFGREGIDGKLLSSAVESLLEVNNGSVFCACRLKQFADAIKKSYKTSPDYIIVEASGLSDPTNIQKILSRDDFSDINYRGAVCLIDAINIFKVFTTATVCKKQILCADIAVVNKTDLVDIGEKNAVLKLISDTVPTVKLFTTSYGIISNELKNEILNLSPSGGTSNGIITKDVSLRKFSIKISETADRENVFEFVKAILKETYRVKGFVKLCGTVYLFDCVADSFKADVYEDTITANGCLQYLVVLSGNSLHTEEAIKKADEKYADVIIKVE